MRGAEEIQSDATQMLAGGAYTPDIETANTDLLACYSLSTTKKSDGTAIYPLDLSDLSGNGLELKSHWLHEDQKEAQSPIQDYDYSMVVIGDQQVVTVDSVSNETTQIADMFQWIKDNAVSKNIKFAFNLGDTANSSLTTTDAYLERTINQWTAGSNALESLTGTIPWSVVRGNHDSIAMFNEYFTYEEHKNRIEVVMMKTC